MDMAVETERAEYSLSDSLRSLRGVLRRRWLTLLLVTGTVLALSVVLIMMIQPKYASTARIQIDPSRNPLQAQDQVRSDLGSEAIETEVTVLNSDELARAVVARLNLGRDPEFTKGLDEREGPPLSAAERTNAIARRVSSNLNVRRDRLTYVINVGYVSHDADKAAAIANGFAETYIDTRVGSRVGTSERQAEFFRRQLAALANEVRAADNAVAQYRANAGITENSGSATIADQQVAPLSSQLATAESQSAEARANLNAARAQIARGGLDSISEVRSSPVVADLRRQRAEVVRAMGEVNARYGPKHAQSITVRQQLEALDAQIKDEAERAVNSLEASARAADARAASLRSNLRALEAEQGRNTRASVNAASLEREAASKRAAYERLSQLSLESTQGTRNQIAQATIIDRAVPSSAPAGPSRKLLLLLAIIASVAIGTATIIVQELLVSGLRSVDDFERRFGLPILAAIPRVNKGASPADLVISKPASMFGEALRMLRASLTSGRGATPPRLIALTSAVPSEGKTNTALALARTLAANGARTLLVDCDARRASLRGLTGAGDRPGLIEVLSGTATVKQAIAPDAQGGLDVLIVREPHFANDELFDSPRFGQLLADVPYDHVVLDLPPLLGVAQSRFIAAMADAVLLIVHWGSTPAAAVESALKSLHNDQANVVGAVFTMVDPSAEAIGGTFYSSKYHDYYQAA